MANFQTKRSGKDDGAEIETVVAAESESEEKIQADTGSEDVRGPARDLRTGFEANRY